MSSSGAAVAAAENAAHPAANDAGHPRAADDTGQNATAVAKPTTAEPPDAQKVPPDVAPLSPARAKADSASCHSESSDNHTETDSDATAESSDDVASLTEMGKLTKSGRIVGAHTTEIIPRMDTNIPSTTITTNLNTLVTTQLQHPPNVKIDDAVDDSCPSRTMGCQFADYGVEIDDPERTAQQKLDYIWGKIVGTRYDLFPRPKGKEHEYYTVKEGVLRGQRGMRERLKFFEEKEHSFMKKLGKQVKAGATTARSQKRQQQLQRNTHRHNRKTGIHHHGGGYHYGGSDDGGDNHTGNSDNRRYSANSRVPRDYLPVRKSGEKKTIRMGQGLKKGFAERLFGENLAKTLGFARGGLLFGGEEGKIPMPMPRSEFYRSGDYYNHVDAGIAGALVADKQTNVNDPKRKNEQAHLIGRYARPEPLEPVLAYIWELCRDAREVEKKKKRLQLREKKYGIVNGGKESGAGGGTSGEDGESKGFFSGWLGSASGKKGADEHGDGIPDAKKNPNSSDKDESKGKHKHPKHRKEKDGKDSEKHHNRHRTDEKQYDSPTTKFAKELEHEEAIVAQLAKKHLLREKHLELYFDRTNHFNSRLLMDDNTALSQLLKVAATGVTDSVVDNVKLLQDNLYSAQGAVKEEIDLIKEGVEKVKEAGEEAAANVLGFVGEALGLRGEEKEEKEETGEAGDAKNAKNGVDTKNGKGSQDLTLAPEQLAKKEERGRKRQEKRKKREAKRKKKEEKIAKRKVERDKELEHKNKVLSDIDALYHCLEDIQTKTAETPKKQKSIFPFGACAKVRICWDGDYQLSDEKQLSLLEQSLRGLVGQQLAKDYGNQSPKLSGKGGEKKAVVGGSSPKAGDNVNLVNANPADTKSVNVNTNTLNDNVIPAGKPLEQNNVDPEGVGLPKRDSRRTVIEHGLPARNSRIPVRENVPVLAGAGDANSRETVRVDPADIPKSPKMIIVNRQTALDAHMNRDIRGKGEVSQAGRTNSKNHSRNNSKKGPVDLDASVDALMRTAEAGSGSDFASVAESDTDDHLEHFLFNSGEPNTPRDPHHEQPEGTSHQKHPHSQEATSEGQHRTGPDVWAKRDAESTVVLDLGEFKDSDSPQNAGSPNAADADNNPKHPKKISLTNFVHSSSGLVGNSGDAAPQSPSSSSRRSAHSRHGSSSRQLTPQANAGSPEVFLSHSHSPDLNEEIGTRSPARLSLQVPGRHSPSRMALTSRLSTTGGTGTRHDDVPVRKHADPSNMRTSGLRASLHAMARVAESGSGPGGGGLGGITDVVRRRSSAIGVDVKEIEEEDKKRKSMGNAAAVSPTGANTDGPVIAFQSPASLTANIATDATHKTISEQFIVHDHEQRLRLLENLKGLANCYTSSKYTGLFQPYRAECALIRLSLAFKPVDDLRMDEDGGKDEDEQEESGFFSTRGSRSAMLVPGVALKIFRDHDLHSANLFFMGKKGGYRSADFFRHPLSNHVSEEVPPMYEPLLNYSRKFTRFPGLLGLSDVASSRQLMWATRKEYWARRDRLSSKGVCSSEAAKISVEEQMGDGNDAGTGIGAGKMNRDAKTIDTGGRAFVKGQETDSIRDANGNIVGRKTRSVEGGSLTVDGKNIITGEQAINEMKKEEGVWTNQSTWNQTVIGRENAVGADTVLRGGELKHKLEDEAFLEKVRGKAEEKKEAPGSAAGQAREGSHNSPTQTQRKEVSFAFPHDVTRGRGRCPMGFDHSGASSSSSQGCPMVCPMGVGSAKAPTNAGRNCEAHSYSQSDSDDYSQSDVGESAELSDESRIDRTMDRIFSGYSSRSANDNTATNSASHLCLENSDQDSETGSDSESGGSDSVSSNDSKSFRDEYLWPAAEADEESDREDVVVSKEAVSINEGRHDKEVPAADTNATQNHKADALVTKTSPLVDDETTKSTPNFALTGFNFPQTDSNTNSPPSPEIPLPQLEGNIQDLLAQLAPPRPTTDAVQYYGACPWRPKNHPSLRLNYRKLVQDAKVETTFEQTLREDFERTGDLLQWKNSLKDYLNRVERGQYMAGEVEAAARAARGNGSDAESNPSSKASTLQSLQSLHADPSLAHFDRILQTASVRNATRFPYQLLLRPNRGLQLSLAKEQKEHRKGSKVGKKRKDSKGKDKHKEAEDKVTDGQKMFPYLKELPSNLVWLAQILLTPPDTPLYEIFARENPDSKELQYLGTIYTAGRFVMSSFGDAGLNFRHQAFEEDLQLRPDWLDLLEKNRRQKFLLEKLQAGGSIRSAFGSAFDYFRGESSVSDNDDNVTPGFAGSAKKRKTRRRSQVVAGLNDLDKGAGPAFMRELVLSALPQDAIIGKTKNISRLIEGISELGKQGVLLSEGIIEGLIPDSVISSLVEDVVEEEVVKRISVVVPGLTDGVRDDNKLGIKFIGNPNDGNRQTRLPLSAQEAAGLKREALAIASRDVEDALARVSAREDVSRMSQISLKERKTRAMRRLGAGLTMTARSRKTNLKKNGSDDGNDHSSSSASGSSSPSSTAARKREKGSKNRSKKKETKEGGGWFSNLFGSAEDESKERLSSASSISPSKDSDHRRRNHRSKDRSKSDRKDHRSRHRKNERQEKGFFAGWFGGSRKGSSKKTSRGTSKETRSGASEESDGGKPPSATNPSDAFFAAFGPPSRKSRKTFSGKSLPRSAFSNKLTRLMQEQRKNIQFEDYVNADAQMLNKIPRRKKRVAKMALLEEQRQVNVRSGKLAKLIEAWQKKLLAQKAGKGKYFASAAGVGGSGSPGRSTTVSPDGSLGSPPIGTRTPAGKLLQTADGRFVGENLQSPRKRPEGGGKSGGKGATANNPSNFKWIRTKNGWAKVQLQPNQPNTGTSSNMDGNMDKWVRTDKGWQQAMAISNKTPPSSTDAVLRSPDSGEPGMQLLTLSKLDAKLIRQHQEHTRIRLNRIRTAKKLRRFSHSVSNFNCVAQSGVLWGASGDYGDLYGLGEIRTKFLMINIHYARTQDGLLSDAGEPERVGKDARTERAHLAKKSSILGKLKGGKGAKGKKGKGKKGSPKGPPTKGAGKKGKDSPTQATAGKSSPAKGSPTIDIPSSTRKQGEEGKSSSPRHAGAGKEPFSALLGAENNGAHSPSSTSTDAMPGIRLTHGPSLASAIPKATQGAAKNASPFGEVDVDAIDVEVRAVDASGKPKRRGWKTRREENLREQIQHQLSPDTVGIIHGSEFPGEIQRPLRGILKGGRIRKALEAEERRQRKLKEEEEKGLLQKEESERKTTDEEAVPVAKLKAEDQEKKADKSSETQDTTAGETAAGDETPKDSKKKKKHHSHSPKDKKKRNDTASKKRKKEKKEGPAPSEEADSSENLSQDEVANRDYYRKIMNPDFRNDYWWRDMPIDTESTDGHFYHWLQRETSDDDSGSDSEDDGGRRRRRRQKIGPGVHGKLDGIGMDEDSAIKKCCAKFLLCRRTNAGGSAGGQKQTVLRNVVLWKKQGAWDELDSEDEADLGQNLRNLDAGVLFLASKAKGVSNLSSDKRKKRSHKDRHRKKDRQRSHHDDGKGPSAEGEGKDSGKRKSQKSKHMKRNTRKRGKRGPANREKSPKGSHHGSHHGSPHSHHKSPHASPKNDQKSPHGSHKSHHESHHSS